MAGTKREGPSFESLPNERSEGGTPGVRCRAS
jgi:hypothetical protein